MLPRFSIEDSRLTTVPAAASRRAPVVSGTERIAGSICGVGPTASASAKVRLSKTGRPSQELAAKTTRTMTSVTSEIMMPKRRMPRVKSVSAARRSKLAAMAPKTVALPVGRPSRQPCRNRLGRQRGLRIDPGQCAPRADDCCQCGPGVLPAL